jgi:hypothetical protein
VLKRLASAARPLHRALAHPLPASTSARASRVDLFDARAARFSTTPPANLPHDGAVIGAGGATFEAPASLSAVPAVKPEGAEPEGKGIYVNGVLNDVAYQSQSMQAIANQTHYEMVGVHNSVQVGGLWKAFRDRVNPLRIPAARTLMRLVKNELEAGREVHLFAHSHGAVVICNAMSRLKKVLHRSGKSEAEISELLQQVKIETYGAASGRFPDGPQYVHYVNERDPVGRRLGLGTQSWHDFWEAMKPHTPALAERWLARPGEGAVVHRFSERPAGTAGDYLPTHVVKTYLSHRKPFSEARRPSSAAGEAAEETERKPELKRRKSI